MTPKQANQLQRNIDSLNSVQLGYLEQYLIINKPTKTLYLLVDKLFEYAYTMDGEPMIVGKVDTFNCGKGKCKLFHPQNLLYHGVIDTDYHSQEWYAYNFQIDNLCVNRMKECW